MMDKALTVIGLFLVGIFLGSCFMILATADCRWLIPGVLSFIALKGVT
jgi:hypothetical protein